MVEKGHDSEQSSLGYSNGRCVAPEPRTDTGPDGSLTEKIGHSDAQKIQLNYVFLNSSSSSENPSPLPLIVSKALIEGPSAGLRLPIINNLKEEGENVELKDIRFWRPSAPLSSRIALNGLKKWASKSENEERSFIAIPLTESISTANSQEWILDKSLIHLIATGPGASFLGRGSSVSDPEGVLEFLHSPSTANTIPEIVMGTYQLGYYPGRMTWQEVQEGERHSKDIELGLISRDTTHQLPSVLLGLQCFSAGARNHESQVMAHVSNVHSNGFRIHFDAFGRTLLFRGQLGWMAIIPPRSGGLYSGDMLQWGTVDSQLSHPRKIGRRSATLRVPFRHPYQQTPTIFSCLAGFIMGGSGSSHWDIRTFVTGIDRNGFNLHVEKIRDSEKDASQVLAHALVSWVAIPGGIKAENGVACGEFHLEDGVRTEKNNGKDVEWRGKSQFPQDFTSPPEVFVAFKSFDTGKQDDSRLKLEIVKTTTSWIEWKVSTWCGTPVYSAVVGFLAVGALNSPSYSK